MVATAGAYVNVQVDMKLRYQESGRKFEIVALELDNGRVPAIEYLRHLKADDQAAHRRLHTVMDMHKDDGPIYNERVSRGLEGDRYHGLYEFKTPQGARLFYFYLPGRVTVLTNGCDKTDPPQPCYEQARGYKLQVEQEIANGAL